MSDQAATIREAARAGDKDFFLAALFAPEEKQPHLFALQAFAAELARIPTLVSEPQIGEIRLQWWADTLEQPEGGQGGHPVAAVLMKAVRTSGLPLQPLQQMIEARRFDLYADRMPDVTSLEAHFGETVSALIQLECLVLDAPAAPRAAEAAGFAGVALGLARGLLKPERDKLIPVGSTAPEMQELAARRLAQARVAVAQLPQSLLPAFLPVATTELYLAAARDGRPQVMQWRRQWRIWRAAKSGV
jgi:phytoene synthase